MRTAPNRTTARLRSENRRYLADLLKRTLRAPCPDCHARADKPCIHLRGPRQGKVMAGRHGNRAYEAVRRGFIDGRIW